MRARGLSCALAALLAAGCHDLPDLGTCGNGIVEEANGEACDDQGDSATCNATCELKCTPEPEGASYVPAVLDAEGEPLLYCPDARHRCGADTICRAPSGAFEPRASAVPFDVGTAPVVGDVDNDGLLDLVGTSATNVYVRFATTTGAPLGEVVVQEAPSSEAPYVIFDRDPGGSDPNRSDLMFAVPTQGVALLRSDDERFAPELDLPIPLPLPPGTVTSPPRGLVVHDPDPLLGDVVVAVHGGSANAEIKVERVEVERTDMMGEPSVGFEALPSCTGVGGGAWRTLAAEAAADRRSFVVVTQRDGAPAWKVCRYTHAAGAWGRAEVDFPVAAPLEAVLANLDGDPCLELAARSATGLAVVDAFGPGCDFAPAIAPVPLPGPLSPLIAAGQITRGGVDELVLAKGVYRACAGPEECGASPAGTFFPIAAPTRFDWTAAAVVDLNGDGALDVVAARGMESDVDVVRGGDVPNVYRADTSARITSVVAGDFDGDRLGDVAMTETVGMGSERIVVLFGTQESIVGSAVAMSGPRPGQLRLARAAEIRWIPSKRGDDGIDDLMVVNVVVGGQPPMPPLAGLVIGDAARLLTTPRFPPTPDPESDLDTLDAVAAGGFRTGAVEVLAIEDSQATFYDLGMNRWSEPISTGAPLRGPVTALRVPGAPSRGAAVDSTTQHVVVFSVGSQGLQERCRIAPQMMPVRELRGVDADFDGTEDLAVLYEQGPARRLRLFSAEDCAPMLADVLPNCADVANVGDRLVALCRDDPAMPGPSRQVISISRDLEPFEIERFQGGDARFVTAGDFDGDGVLDVAVSVHRVDEVGVHYLRQCPEHDTRTCPRRPPPPR